jgi:hypothetical protein
VHQPDAVQGLRANSGQRRAFAHFARELVAAHGQRPVAGIPRLSAAIDQGSAKVWSKELAVLNEQAVLSVAIRNAREARHQPGDRIVPRRSLCGNRHTANENSEQRETWDQQDTSLHR